MLPISICFIMKNEARHLRPFLSAIKKQFKGYPHEIIGVDTGSSDESCAIASEYVTSLHHFKWINDFSAAKNYAISKASYDWILFLDCDEYLKTVSLTCFEKMAKQFPMALGMIKLKNHYHSKGSNSTYTEDVERFFNRTCYHYEGIVHEQLTPSSVFFVSRAEIPVLADHYGYDGTEEEMAAKVNRNIELLLTSLRDHPDDPYLHFQLGQSYNAISDVKNAYKYYKKGLSFDVNPKLEYVKMMVTAYGYCMLDLNKNEEALTYEGIYDSFADNADFVCLMGLIYLRNGQLEQAVNEFEKATSFDTCATEGTNSFIPWYNLGCICEVLGDVQNATLLYEQCGQFAPALKRLDALK